MFRSYATFDRSSDPRIMPTVTRVATYQTRLLLTSEQVGLLDRYAALYGRAQRSLFAARQRPGFDANAAKRDFCVRFGLTARQYNALRMELDGKVDSILERRKGLLDESAQRIARAEKLVAKLKQQIVDLSNPQAAFKSGRWMRTMTDAQRLERIAAIKARLHQKQRRLKILQDRRAAMDRDARAGRVRLCFGSRKLFGAQFHLEDNGYTDHAAWRRDWQAARNGQFLVVGSEDETAGNQTCQAEIQPDGSLNLRLRLPDALGGITEIVGVRFAYGHDSILKALQSSQVVMRPSKTGRMTRTRTGSAISYRFVRDTKGWRVFATVEEARVITTSAQLGAVGVDLNADHLAVARVDRFGNLVETLRLDTLLQGKTTEQRKAILGGAAKVIVQMAAAHGVPVVMERLDFSRRKAEMEGVDPRRARMLNALAYRQAHQMISGACFKAGIEVRQVNPAYTSTIGAVNFALPHGVSVHLGAAAAIARRAMGWAERPRSAPPKFQTTVSHRPATNPVLAAPARSGGHVTFARPARNRAKHVWSQWAAVRRGLRAALAAHARSAKAAPDQPSTPDLSATRVLQVRVLHASPEHCSRDEFVDVPY